MRVWGALRVWGDGVREAEGDRGSGKVLLCFIATPVPDTPCAALYMMVPLPTFQIRFWDATWPTDMLAALQEQVRGVRDTRARVFWRLPSDCDAVARPSCRFGSFAAEPVMWEND